MKRAILLVLAMLVSFSFIACERKTTVIREGVVAPQPDPAVKIRINDGSGSGVDVNIPTKK
ncbi:MAG: hypothetical protein Q8P84_07235 [Deltaproteobacteria bacterium]|nr:hypothetical protein [Deltaproteobacteria bacterium]